MARAAGVALGHQSLVRDLGHCTSVRVWTDSGAAMGICQRQWLGKFRHISTQALWIQQRVRDRSIELRKVRGEVNPADLFTKHLPSREKLEQLIWLFGCACVEGRAAVARMLHKGAE